MRGRTHTILKFFKTAKGLLIVILAILVAIAGPGEDFRTVAPGLFSAVIAAGLLDAVIIRARRIRTPRKDWDFPSGAVITALIVAMVVRAQEPWYIPAVASVIAVLSKYVFRSRAANVFNPAALAIVIMFYAFHTSQSWWGALPEVAPIFQVALVAGGVFIADRVNKMPLMLVFLGTYYLLFTITAYVGDPQRVAEVFRAPDLQAALYFAFFILTDPPTSPVKYRDQLIFGVIVAVVSFGVFEWIGAVYYLLAGVLAGNAWEAWGRVTRRTGTTFPRGIGTFLREITFLRTRARAAR